MCPQAASSRLAIAEQGYARTLPCAAASRSSRSWAARVRSPAADAQRALEQETYRITTQSDRMGYRLQGPELGLVAPREMVSEAVAFGAIQVPADGQPIILMADRQTTGGYPKIAHVCAVDLPRLAQQIPGDSVRFELVDLAE